MTSSLAGVTGVAPECLPAQIRGGFEHRLSTTSIYFACYFAWSVASSCVVRFILLAGLGADAGAFASTVAITNPFPRHSPVFLGH